MEDLQDNLARLHMGILKEQLTVEEMEIMDLDLARILIGTTILGGGLIWDPHNALSKYPYQIEAIAAGID